jgi:hypothetical protein
LIGRVALESLGGGEGLRSAMEAKEAEGDADEEHKDNDGNHSYHSSTTFQEVYFLRASACCMV